MKTQSMFGWKDIALAAAVVLILILLVVMNYGGDKRINPAKALVKIENQDLSEGDLLRALKRQYGSQALIKMVDEAMYEKLATKQGIVVTDADVDQLLNDERLWESLAGRDLDKTLEAAGVSVDEIRHEFRQMAVQIKLTVPQQDIQALIDKAAKDDTPPLSLPARYKIRRFLFTREVDANLAATQLRASDPVKDTGTLSTVAQMCLNADEARHEILYAPGITRTDPGISRALQSLKAGETSDPFPIALSQPRNGKPGMQGYCLVQLLEMHPAEKPTMENRGLIAGKMLIKTDKKYQEKLTDLEAKGVNDLYWRFLPASADYPEAAKHFNDVKVKNPEIPGFNDEEPGAAHGKLKPPGATPQKTPAPVKK